MPSNQATRELVEQAHSGVTMSRMVSKSKWDRVDVDTPAHWARVYIFSSARDMEAPVVTVASIDHVFPVNPPFDEVFNHETDLVVQLVAAGSLADALQTHFVPDFETPEAEVNVSLMLRMADSAEALISSIRGDARRRGKSSVVFHTDENSHHMLLRSVDTQHEPFPEGGLIWRIKP